MSKFIQEFKEFALKGSVMDMAVGIIIGGAFGKIVDSLVKDVIMPPITLLTDKGNFSDLKWVLRSGIEEAGEVVRPEVAITIGNFIQALIDFLIIALVIFMLVRGINKLRRTKEEEPAAAPQPSEEVQLLREIRDNLKK
ncbi:large-conductance mechanosensitive channel protein MscL [Porphyromonas miyakawae]|uniref:Large-conductance mechanosensitive channel n=1 Tax=Porphyromonas miyakawae TaxID=3137470 RepID=A0ABQ0E1Y2_9PORP